jgi:hypothetical protein
VVGLRVWATGDSARVPAAVASALLPHAIPTPAVKVTDGPLTPWAFVLLVLAVCGVLGLMLWRVLEATLLRLH